MFGKYVGEILLSEGMTDFEFIDIDRAFEQLIEHKGLVILTRCRLKFKEIEQLVEHIKQGGHIIMIQPSAFLLAALEIKSRKLVTPKAYILPDSRHAASHALIHETIQTHVPVEHYECKEVETIAHAYRDKENAAGYPAVISCSIGKGRIGVFFYDPAKAVARIRFGDPELTGMHTLGKWSNLHPADLFTDHIDPDRAHIPQADMHCILLGNMVQYVSNMPIARWWFYPHWKHQSAVIFRSDGDFSEPEHFEALTRAVENRKGHVTYYLMRGTKLSAQAIKAYMARGHGFGVHPHPRPKKEDPYFTAGTILTDDIAHLKKLCGLDIKTFTFHGGYWRGYMDLVPTYVKNGIRLTVPYTSLLTLHHKYMTGSGRAMRFVDCNGHIYDCYQQSTQSLDDESLQDIITTQPEAELEKVNETIQNSIKSHHSPLGFQSHPVSFATYSRKFIEGVFDMAAENDMPILSTDEWADFNDLRNKARFSLEDYGGNTWQYAISSPAKGLITAMIPILEHSTPDKIVFDGQDIDCQVTEMFGFGYLVVEIEPKTALHTITIRF